MPVMFDLRCYAGGVVVAATWPVDASSTETPNRAPQAFAALARHGDHNFHLFLRHAADRSKLAAKCEALRSEMSRARWR